MNRNAVRIPKLLTEREVAKVFGVSIDTIRRLRRAGRIAYTCIGGRIRYTEEHLLAYLERETRPCGGDKVTAWRDRRILAQQAAQQSRLMPDLV